MKGSIRKASAAVAGLSIAALAGSLADGAAAQANCEWYARTALRQQQLNEQQKCGFKGDAWSADLRAHVSWCSAVSPDLWKAQAQQRDTLLTQCAKK